MALIPTFSPYKLAKLMSNRSIFARFLPVLIACFVTAGLEMGVANSEDLPIAYSGRIAGDENSTRLLLDFDKEVSVKAFYMDHPDRIVIDLNETIFNLGDGDALKPRGLISFMRHGAIVKGRSRIVLSLASPAEIVESTVKPHGVGTAYRLVLDLAATNVDHYSELVASNNNARDADNNLAVRGDRPKAEAGDTGKITVVIDPGHGGIDGGAVGYHRAIEKDLVLSFAKLFEEKLRLAGPFDVKLTRDSDEFVSLNQRLAFAQDVEADLFISIHADSLKQRDVRGSTVYTLSKKASDLLSEQLAKSENSVDLVAGLSLPEEVEVVTDILADLTTRETKQFSRQFSGILVSNLQNRIKLIKNPRRSASFEVLKAPEVPGVLFELGYLSNAEDEKLLRSPEWQAKVADALTRSVVTFFEPRLGE